MQEGGPPTFSIILPQIIRDIQINRVVGQALANPRAVEKHASAAFRSAPVTANCKGLFTAAGA
jgi:hypothetical protein